MANIRQHIMTAFLTIGFAVLLAGCRNPQPEQPVRHKCNWDLVVFERSELKDWGNPELRQLNVVYFHWGDAPVLMVWFDGSRGWELTYSGGDGPSMQFRGPFTSHPPPLAKNGYFDVEVRDAKTAQFLLTAWPQGGVDNPFLTGGRVNDVKDGACFLASGMTGEMRVKQLNIDMAKVKFAKERAPNGFAKGEGLLAVAAAEPEIKAFFAKAGK
ncbi:MAG: hypothetical protein HY289_16780 [Planctomycetes bacterium]|nr:hypothetical protein [Planctomycetota bacterium]